MLYFSHIDDVNDEKIKPALVPTVLDPLVHELTELIEIGSLMTVESGCRLVNKLKTEGSDKMIIEVLDVEFLEKNRVHRFALSNTNLKSIDRDFIDKLRRAIKTWLQKDPFHGKKLFEQMRDKNHKCSGDENKLRKEVEFLYSSIEK